MGDGMTCHSAEFRTGAALGQLGQFVLKTMTCPSAPVRGIAKAIYPRAGAHWGGLVMVWRHWGKGDGK
jgi:hypothetical protein